MILTEQERSLLVDTIDQAIEGHKDSKERAMADCSLETKQAFEYLEDTDQTIAILTKVKEKVLHDA